MPRRKTRLIARVAVLDGTPGGPPGTRPARLLVARHRRETGEEFWCLPGGTVEEGERFADAARREIAEEAGVSVELDGVVWVNDLLADPSGRSRVELFFAARLTGTVPRPPAADRHLLEVAWRSLDELAAEDFRPAVFLDALRRGPLPALPYPEQGDGPRRPGQRPGPRPGPTLPDGG